MYTYRQNRNQERTKVIESVTLYRMIATTPIEVTMLASFFPNAVI